MTSGGWAQSQLDRELFNSPVKLLATQVVESGDPSRGAVLFYSTTLGCSQCHRLEDSLARAMGPNLADWKPDNPKPTAEYIIESILRPSSVVAPAYAATRVLTSDGEVFSGVVTSRTPAALHMRFGPRDEDVAILESSDIEKEVPSETSIMPAGMVQQLDDRQQFLDLVAYVMAIAEGGPSKALALQPSQQMLQAKLPEYESHVDHAGIVSSWNKKSLERGRKIYHGLCVNCHGTRENVGSLPTALRFGNGKFKQGSDPYSIYKTLTHGSGLMLPQKWMVPQQKYDVIHFIREEFLKDVDSQAYTPLSEAYLRSLPLGDTRGPEPIYVQPWVDMDYGNIMATTIEFGKNGSNIAQKGMSFRLDSGTGGISKGRLWMTFEHDTLRWAAGWKGSGFIDWHGIQFDGAHGVHPRAVGDIEFANPTGPGWADPETGSFDDVLRVEGRDGKRYGPLPSRWAKYSGLRRGTQETAILYSIDQRPVEEIPFAFKTKQGNIFFGRSIQIQSLDRTQTMLVATLNEPKMTKLIHDNAISVDWKGTSDKAERMVATFHGDKDHIRWKLVGNRLCLEIDPQKQKLNFAVALSNTTQPLDESEWNEVNAWIRAPSIQDIPKSVDPVTSIASTSKLWFEGNGWAVDELIPPSLNPWKARTRITGLAFYPNQDAMAVCTWDGDIWKVSGLQSLDNQRVDNLSSRAMPPKILWNRIATGLFQPLGILAYEESVMVTCRDQLVKLKDLNGDGVMDDYQCFNSDHQVTEHFHEFAMGLQQDPSGNFYYAKSARHALKAVVPHHGTLLRVSPEGSTTEILATGFRAANGVCINPDGTFVVTDQEGHWNPKNRINWVEPGKFYGNMFGYHSVQNSADSEMEPPLCWITNSFDRSPAELLWANSDRWGALQGSLLNLSYGYGRIYVVPFETVNGLKQGGMCALPIPDLPTGIVRGRFSPRDGQLYVGGMFAWASSRQDQEGGIYRIRRTGSPVDLPTKLNVSRSETGNPMLAIEFTDELDVTTMTDVSRYQIKIWDIRRTEKYGSDHFREQELMVSSVQCDPDKRRVQLEIPDLKPTWCMSVDIQVKSIDGREVHRTIHNTIHQFPTKGKPSH